MIVSIEGNITYHGLGFVIVETGGIGYKIVLPEDVAHAQHGQVRFYTHEIIREPDHELFGFASIEALELFWKLIGVSGVGPRTAQKIVFADTVEKTKERIMAGDLSFLTNVPGIGKKTAQKIILELKGALAQEPEFSIFDSDAVEALISLGYSRKDAENILSGVSGETTEERIRAALKTLGR